MTNTASDGMPSVSPSFNFNRVLNWATITPRAIKAWNTRPAKPSEDVIHAWLDEHGRVVSREDNHCGGFVGKNRAIPDSWTPLYTRYLPPAPKAGGE